VTGKTTLIGKRRSAARKEPRASYQNRRQEISEAAVKVFNRLGYNGASLTAVAAELNVDRATIYYYFSSKEQLFDEITRAVLEKNLELARKIAESKISPRRKLREIVTALMVSYGENYPLLYIYIREDLAHVSDARSEWSSSMRRINREIQQALVAIIEQGYADDSLRRVGHPNVVASGILGMLNWTHRWFKPDTSSVSADEIGKTYAELVLSGLESPY